jgi:hypothetical protein
MSRSGQDKFLDRQESKRQQLEQKLRRLQERNDLLETRVRQMLEESEQSRRELEKLLPALDADYQPASRPTWPTFIYLWACMKTYSEVAIVVAVLSFLAILVYSFPLYIALFSLGAFFMCLSMRTMRMLYLKIGRSRILNPIWRVIGWDYLIKY